MKKGILTFIIVGILYIMFTYPWNWLIKIQVEKYGYQKLLSLVDDKKLKCVKNKGILINRNDINHLDIVDIFCESDAFIIFLDRFIASGNGIIILKKNTDINLLLTSRKIETLIVEKLYDRIFYFYWSGSL